MVKQKLSKGCYSNKKGGSQANTETAINKTINPNIYNYATILSFISPYILISFFVLLSIFNVNAKGIMYFIGSMMLLGFVLLAIAS